MRPSSLDRAREASDTSDPWRDGRAWRRCGESSSSWEDKEASGLGALAWVVIEMVLLVGIEDESWVDGWLVREAGGFSLHSGYSSSNRWIIRSSV